MRSSALKPEILEGRPVVIRELTGGLYFGQPSERRDTGHGREAIDTCFYRGRDRTARARRLRASHGSGERRSRPSTRRT
jgi:3-isopropylmalate dehydrogenase